MDKLFDLLDNMSIIKAFKKCSEGLFFISYILIIFFYGMQFTEFPQTITIHLQPIFDLLPAVLIFFKVAFTEYREWKRWPFYILFLALGLIVDNNSTVDLLYTVILLLIGANHISFEKILKVQCVVMTGILLSALACALTGVIDNLAFLQDERGYRYGMGMIYPVDCAAYYLYLLMAFSYAFRKKLKWWCGFFGIGLAIILWFCTKARNNCFCMILFSVIFMFFKLRDSGYFSFKISELFKNIYRKTCQYSVLFFAIVMIAGSIFCEKITFISKIMPGTFWSRFILGLKGYTRYDIKLFGNSVFYKFSGDYFFLDSSYHQLLIVYGFIALVTVIFTYIIFCDKFKNNKYLLAIVFIIALQSCMEYHMLDVSFNSIILALTAVTTENTITVKANDR